MISQITSSVFPYTPSTFLSCMIVEIIENWLRVHCEVKKITNGKMNSSELYYRHLIVRGHKSLVSCRK